MSQGSVSKLEPVAVIDIGTSAIRMVIAEVGPKAEIRYLENLQKSVRLGKDVFATERISSAGMRECLGVLKDFKSVIDSYGVKRVQAIGTSAVREAANRENFIDQIFVRTGIDIEILEGPEENRLELIAVEHALGDQLDLSKKNCLIVEVGSGSTEVILLHQGEVQVTRTLSMGSMRLPERTVAGKTEPAVIQRVLKRSIHDVIAQTTREYRAQEVDTFIALGADMRLAARSFKDKVEGGYLSLEKKEFMGFLGRIAKATPEDIAHDFGISYGQAETLYPSLLVYSNFLAETKAESVVIPMTSIRDGLLLELAQMLSGYKRTDVAKQILNSARHLAEKYQYDKAHASCVASLAIKLFDALKEDHGMNTKYRLLLEASGILHDIGAYISPTAHHKHSSYLVDAAEIFGLRKADKNIVSNVVRYHRRATPQPSHVAYMSLARSDRAVVSKLGSILRVADALDHSHQQKIRDFTLTRTKDQYTLWIPVEAGDISLERNFLREKGSWFADVFGAAVMLKQGEPQT